MKKVKRIGLVLMTIMILSALSLISANAAGKNINLLKVKDGFLEEDETASYDFIMPADGTAILRFGDDVFGECRITIKDDKSNKLYSKYECVEEGYLEGEKKSINIDLKKGNYSLIIENVEEDWGFDYDFSLDASIKTTNIKFNVGSINLEKGKTTTLKAVVEPANSGEAISWISSNKNVATVDKNGKVTAKALGKATITAKSGTKSAKCALTVNKINSLTVCKGSTLDLKNYVKNISGYKNGSWKISGKTIASISSSGIATGKSAGSASVTFTAKDGIKYTLNIKVYDIKKNYSFKSKKVSLTNGKSKTYSFKIPADSYTTIQFNKVEEKYYGDTRLYSLTTIKDSAGKTVYSKSATVSGNKKYSIFLKKGEYKLTLKEIPDDLDDIYYYYGDFNLLVSLYYQVCSAVKTTKLSVGKTSLNMEKGKTATLSAVVTPSYATDTLIWSTSNKSVAAVDKNGKVTAKVLGKATITAKSGTKTVKCKVTVNKISLSLLKKKTLNLQSYVKNIPDYKKGTWSSSNKSVATVNSSGVVTGKASGSCSITFKAKGGTKYTIALIVRNWVTAKVIEIDDEDVYNDCWIRITNYTKKDITYVELKITQYDNRGYRLTSPYDIYYTNETLKAGYRCDYMWWVNDDTKKASVKIVKVWFADGTTYTP